MMAAISRRIVESVDNEATLAQQLGEAFLNVQYSVQEKESTISSARYNNVSIIYRETIWPVTNYYQKKKKENYPNKYVIL